MGFGDSLGIYLRGNLSVGKVEVELPCRELAFDFFCLYLLGLFSGTGSVSRSHAYINELIYELLWWGMMSRISMDIVSLKNMELVTIKKTRTLIAINSSEEPDRNTYSQVPYSKLRDRCQCLDWVQDIRCEEPHSTCDLRNYRDDCWKGQKIQGCVKQWIWARPRVLISDIGRCDVTYYVVHSVHTTNQFEGNRNRSEHSKSCQPKQTFDEQANERDESRNYRCGSWTLDTFHRLPHCLRV